MIDERAVDEIIDKIKSLKPGTSCVYYRGLTRWMEEIPEEPQKKLQDFFERAHERNHYFFTSRRVSQSRISTYEYIATKSIKIR